MLMMDKNELLAKINSCLSECISRFSEGDSFLSGMSPIVFLYQEASRRGEEKSILELIRSSSPTFVEVENMFQRFPFKDPSFDFDIVLYAACAYPTKEQSFTFIATAYALGYKTLDSVKQVLCKGKRPTVEVLDDIVLTHDIPIHKCWGNFDGHSRDYVLGRYSRISPLMFGKIIDELRQENLRGE